MKEALCAIQAPTGCSTARCSTARQSEEIHNHEDQESNFLCVMIEV